jgi:GNAT superfamily N-acetyltransferase
MDNGVWYLRVTNHDGSPSRLLAIESSRMPDAAVETVTEADFDDSMVIGWRCQVGFHGGRPANITMAPDLVAKAPDLWFCEFHEDEATPPTAVHLIVFTGHNQPAGALLDHAAVSTAGISYDTQLAAMRFYPATGELHQMYVQPAWRRYGIGRTLIYATGALSIAHGWPRIWAGGLRTEQGEQFRQSSPVWVTRSSDLTETAPPMTPGEAS